MGYGRVIAGDRNRLIQGCGSLTGIAAGLLADSQLNDAEIQFLSDWLSKNEIVADQWPGDVLCDRVRRVLADGVITAEERDDIVKTLNAICGGMLDSRSEGAVNQLAFDEAEAISFSGTNFCVTGDFIFGPRERVCKHISERGGIVLKGVTKKLNYLIVGVRGSNEWKHGTFGTKIAKAIEYKRAGIPIAIVREDHWSAALKA